MWTAENILGVKFSPKGVTRKYYIDIDKKLNPEDFKDYSRVDGWSAESICRELNSGNWVPEGEGPYQIY